MKRAVYLDYNATAPIRPEALEAAALALQIGGNPSSVHARGRRARAAVETARAQVGALVGAGPEQVVFTSGGTEANRLAIEAALASGSRRLVVLATEHDSTLRPALASGAGVEVWPVRPDGVADLDWLHGRLARWDRTDGAPFVAVSLANGETGVLQPIAEIAAKVREAGGVLHVDAVQAAGRLALDMAALGAHTLSLSGHKLGAPQGVGALIVTPGGPVRARRAVVGAYALSPGQEQGLRAGTENVAGIAGFGAAAEAALRDLPCAHRQAPWRDAAEARLRAAGARIAGEGAPRLPGVLCAVRHGWPSERQVMALDLEGVMVSAGSACSSGKVGASHVLAAMGLGPDAGYAVRASGGWATIGDDWIAFADVWLAAHARQAARRKVKEFA